MNKGDTLQLTLNYKLNNVDLKEDDCDDIELQLNSQSNGNSLKFLLSEEEIIWDSTLNKFKVMLSQKNTFKLKENELNEDSEIEYQLRVLINDSVASSSVGTFTLGPVLSKKVLGDE